MPATMRARELVRGRSDPASAPRRAVSDPRQDASQSEIQSEIEEGGFTLIEILLTLVILSTVILALFTATVAIYAYSAAQRDMAIMNGALTERLEEMSGVPVSGGNEVNPANTPNQYANTEQICVADGAARSRATTANPIGSSSAVTVTMTPTHFLSLSVSPSGQTTYSRTEIDDIAGDADLAPLCRQASLYAFDVKAEYLDRSSTMTIYRSWKP